MITRGFLLNIRRQILAVAILSFIQCVPLFADIGALESVVTPPGTCGDVIVEASNNEECDEGPANSWAPNATCRPDCQLPGCWDRVLDSGEECIPGDVCAAALPDPDPSSSASPMTTASPSGTSYCSNTTCKCINCDGSDLTACSDFDVSLGKDEIELNPKLTGCGEKAIHEAFIDHAIANGWSGSETICKGKNPLDVTSFTNEGRIEIPINIKAPAGVDTFDVQTNVSSGAIRVVRDGDDWSLVIEPGAMSHKPTNITKSDATWPGCLPSYRITHGWYSCATYTTDLSADAAAKVNVEVSVKTDCCEKKFILPLNFTGDVKVANISHVAGNSPVSINLSANSVRELLPTLAKFPLGSQDPRYVLWYGSETTGILVYDPKKTGKIFTEEQLIGTKTKGGSFEDGFAALASFDADQNGTLEKGELADIRIWFDTGRDAQSSEDEVRDLSGYGIEKIATQFTNSYTVPLHEIRILENAKGATQKNGAKALVFDWFLPIADTKEKWEQSIASYRAEGYYIFEEEEVPAWELNKNNISGYYALKVDKDNKISGFFVAANYNLSDSGKVKEFAVFSEKVNGKVEANGQAVFSNQGKVGTSLTVRHTTRVEDFLRKAKAEAKLYGKKEIVVEENGKVVESFQRGSILRKDVKVSEFVQ